MALMTKEKLESMLQREVDGAHILVAKNMIQGSTSQVIAEMLGCEHLEIQSMMQSEEYKEVFTLISANHNEGMIDNAFTIDDIEQRAWGIVSKRLDVEKDIEVAARIAMMANKATRRQNVQAEALDPRKADTTVRIQLTKRIIESIQTSQIISRPEDRVLGAGRAINPTFKQVESFFESKESHTIENVAPRREEEITLEAIMDGMNRRG